MITIVEIKAAAAISAAASKAARIASDEPGFLRLFTPALRFFTGFPALCCALRIKPPGATGC
jgi:hypothetical protein